MTTIKVVAFDIDGSMVPQGGQANPNVMTMTRDFRLATGIPMGPATGKNADYARGFANGFGGQWEFIIAEAGAQFLYLIQQGPPPIWEQRENIYPQSDISLFAQIIQLNQYDRTFLFRKRQERYRPELKEGIITLFPPGKDLDISLGWHEYFQAIVETHKLLITLKRHSDGCIDVMPDGVNKRVGINELCRLYCCQPEEILTLVDGSNDDELAENTTAIAVANAVPKIKELVKRQNGFVSTFPDGFGFAQGLLYYSRLGMLPREVEQIVLKHIPEVDNLGDKATVSLVQ